MTCRGKFEGNKNIIETKKRNDWVRRVKDYRVRIPNESKKKGRGEGGVAPTIVSQPEKNSERGAKKKRGETTK